MVGPRLPAEVPSLARTPSPGRPPAPRPPHGLLPGPARCAHVAWWTPRPWVQRLGRASAKASGGAPCRPLPACRPQAAATAAPFPQNPPRKPQLDLTQAPGPPVPLTSDLSPLEGRLQGGRVPAQKLSSTQPLAGGCPPRSWHKTALWGHVAPWAWRGPASRSRALVPEAVTARTATHNGAWSAALHSYFRSGVHSRATWAPGREATGLSVSDGNRRRLRVLWSRPGGREAGP